MCVSIGVLAGVMGCQVPDSARGTDSLFALFAPPTPQQAAAWATDEYNPDLQYRGTILLANASFGGEPPYIEMYLDYLNHTDSNVRAAAARGLANHGGPEHAPLLAEKLTFTVEQRQLQHVEPDPFVRQESARALQRLHNPEVVEALLGAMVEPTPAEQVVAADADPEVRAAAAHALGQYAEIRVLEALFNTGLSDSSLVVNRNARASLRTLTGQDFGYARRAWREWFDGAGREAPFAARRAYVYPVFQRAPSLIERLPFVPPPPNEPASTPVGFSPVELLNSGAVPE